MPRQAGGRARTRPDRVRADKAYSSRAIRTHLRRRRIQAVIPEPADQAGHPKRRGSRGGRPPAFNEVDYPGRNVIEWCGIATRYDKLATLYRAAILIHDVITWTKTHTVRHGLARWVPRARPFEERFQDHGGLCAGPAGAL